MIIEPVRKGRLLALLASLEPLDEIFPDIDVIRGTRVPVAIVVGSLAAGMTFEEIEREYDLTTADIRAALKFASELLDQESFVSLSSE